MKTNKAEFEDLVEKCFAELGIATREKYDEEKAEKVAAMFLLAQGQLAFFIADIEFQARFSKNEISRIEGSKYFDLKTSATSKITEAGLTQLVAKDEDVIAAKRGNCEAEAEAKKFNYLMASLKEGHVFF